MAPPRLLIASHSDAFCADLSEALSDRYDICLCHDGEAALSLLRSIRFDILVIDLLLPQLDGLSVVETIRKENIPTKVLAITSILTNYIMDCVERLHIGYLMRKPFRISAVAARVMDLERPALPALPTRNMYAYLSGVLTSFPMKPTWLGFRLLRSAILLSVRSPNMSATKELYPAAAKLCGISGSNAERNMRSALDGAWAAQDHSVWLQFFPPSDKRPEPSDFIARLAQDLRLKQSQGLLDPWDPSDFQP